MAKEQPEKTEHELAIVKFHEAEGQLFAEGELFHLTGIGQHAAFLSAQTEVHRVLAYKRVHDKKLYKCFGTWERYCALVGESHRALLESFQTLQTLGLDLMHKAEALKLPRESIRQLRQLNEPTLREIQVALDVDDLSADDAKRLVASAIGVACDERGKRQLAEETVKRRDEDLAKRRESERREHDKRVAAETEAQRLRLDRTVDAEYSTLVIGACRALNDLSEHLRTEGIDPDDAKRFIRDHSLLRKHLDDSWQSFIAPPDGKHRGSHAQHVKWLQEARSLTKDQAEEAASEQ